MFILVAPLLEVDRIKLPPSSQNIKSELSSFSEDSTIKIQVFADNSIALNGASITLKELAHSLKKNLQPQNLQTQNLQTQNLKTLEP